MANLLGRKRLRDEADSGSQTNATLSQDLLGGVSRHEKGADIRPQALQAIEKLEAVQARHHNVQ
jgi:hypothetical protein